MSYEAFSHRCPVGAGENNTTNNTKKQYKMFADWTRVQIARAWSKVLTSQLAEVKRVRTQDGEADARTSTTNSDADAGPTAASTPGDLFPLRLLFGDARAHKLVLQLHLYGVYDAQAETTPAECYLCALLRIHATLFSPFPFVEFVRGIYAAALYTWKRTVDVVSQLQCFLLGNWWCSGALWAK